MGTYRFVLAIAVALSHMGVTFGGTHNPGVVAVISFFLISGYVMTGLIHAYYSDYNEVLMFYVDRLARIFPQYLFFLVMAVVGNLSLGIVSPYLSEVSMMGVLANLVLVPLDFFMYSKTVAACMYIPQAWSLGLELTFYLVFPLILISGQRTTWLILSLLIWLFAAFGVVDTDVWGYRLLPGTLFVFLLGSCIFDNKTPSWNHGAIAALLLLLGCAVILYVANRIAAPYNFEVLLGIFIGVPCVFILSSFKRSRWDDRLGDLSYGLFLSHFLAISIFDLFAIPHGFVSNSLMMILSLLLAYLGYVAVEQPVLKWRRNLRRLSKKN